jgi:NADPH:quinone reductase
VAAEADWVVPLPDELDDARAATIPLNGLTAVRALDLLDLSPSSTLLVTGASGSVGGFGVQLAVRAGHRVMAQAAGDDDEEWVRGLGADAVVPRSVDLAEIGPVDAVFDAVPLGPPAAAAVADGGSVVTTRSTAPIEPSRGVRQQVVWVQLDRDKLRALVDDVAYGRLQTRVAATIPLADAPKAHRLVEGRGLRGKVIITP